MREELIIEERGHMLIEYHRHGPRRTQTGERMQGEKTIREDKKDSKDKKGRKNKNDNNDIVDKKDNMDRKDRKNKNDNKDLEDKMDREHKETRTERTRRIQEHRGQQG